MAPRKLLRAAPDGDDQIEMFVPDVGDLPIKDKHSLMTLPLLHIGDYRGNAKKIDHVEYFINGAHIEVKAPKDTGIATIRDYDVILFFISTIVDWKNQGKDLSRGIELHAHSLLKFTRRGSGRKQYEMLEHALDRLKSTVITIKYKDKNSETVKSVGWLEDYEFERDDKTGKFGTLHLTIPQWIHTAANQHKSILTLHRDYFLVSSPQARWLYRLIRKSAGNNNQGWRYSIKELYNRSGSNRSFRKWKYDLKELLKTGPILDYHTSRVIDENKNEYLYFIKDEQLLKLMSNPPKQLHDFQKIWIDDQVVKSIEKGVRHENRFDD